MQKKLITIFQTLPPEAQEQLVLFAEFLAYKKQDHKPQPPKPEILPRPEIEKVHLATKRLSKSYYMLDKSKMLNETSMLIGQHVMQGREAKEVIDDLEALFEKHYQKFLEEY